MRELLDLYRLRLGDPTSGELPTTGVMFATAINTPLDLKNVYTRQIEPALTACAECGEAKKKHKIYARLADHEYRRKDLPVWHGWHAFRRGLATNLNDLGVLDLTIQRILRHSDVTTTRKHYVKPLDHQLTESMEKLEVDIRRAERRVN